MQQKIKNKNNHLTSCELCLETTIIIAIKSFDALLLIAAIKFFTTTTKSLFPNCFFLANIIL